MPFEMLSPNPVLCPTCFVVKNGCPTLSLNCFAIPFPLSITEISTSAATFVTLTSTHFSGDGCTASTALFNKFRSTCEISVGRQSMSSDCSTGDTRLLTLPCVLPECRFPSHKDRSHTSPDGALFAGAKMVQKAAASVSNSCISMKQASFNSRAGSRTPLPSA